MATLAPGGRITSAEVEEELERLGSAWGVARQAASGGGVEGPDAEAILVSHPGADAAARLDRFDRVQLAEVLGVCAGAKSLSEAGRVLFAESRKAKRSSNDADRLRKYLARFGLAWEHVARRR